MEQRTKEILVVAIGIVIVTSTIFAVYQLSSTEDDQEIAFPVENAIIVYRVETMSQIIGVRKGIISYSVTDVSENSYTIRRTASENLDVFFENTTRTLPKDTMFGWPNVPKEGELIDNQTISSDGSKLVLQNFSLKKDLDNKYLFRLYDLRLIEELNRRSIPKKLENSLQTRGYNTSENGSLSVLEENHSWKLEYPNKSYMIKRNNDEINIYQLDYGEESINMWKIKDVNIPIRIRQETPDGYTTMELIETNIDYLIF